MIEINGKKCNFHLELDEIHLILTGWVIVGRPGMIVGRDHVIIGLDPVRC